MHEQKSACRRNFVGTVGVNASLGIMHLFVTVFLIAQVFMITGYSISSVALFILVDATAIFGFYVLSTFICKKLPAIWMVRLAGLLACVFLVLVVVWERGLYSHFILFGALWGTVQGFCSRLLLGLRLIWEVG